MSIKQKSECLYRWYNWENKLLYVGITSNIGARIKDHKRQSGWANEAEYIELEWFYTREEVEAAERVAIRNEKPKYNKAHTIFDEFRNKKDSLDRIPYPENGRLAEKFEWFAKEIRKQERDLAEYREQFRRVQDLEESINDRIATYEKLLDFYRTQLKEEKWI